MQDVAIRAEGLTVVRGGKTVLDGLTFGIEPGKLTGLIGPSGSGKTTLMRAIVGAQVITGGSLHVLGDVAGSKSLRRQIGYVTQEPAVYADLTTRQNLQYFAAILGKGKADVQRVIDQVDLRPQTNQMVGSLSGGQYARVSLAVALLGGAQVLVLDEPTVGLDPLLRERLWGLFRDLAREGHTLLISSHVMDEAEKCDDVMLLRGGKILSHGAKHELLQKTRAQSVEAAFLKLVKGGEDAS
jgi:ABC-2 type transport system ATP-binding protein